MSLNRVSMSFCLESWVDKKYWTAVLKVPAVVKAEMDEFATAPAPTPLRQLI